MWGNRLPMASLAKLGYRSGLQIDLKTRLAGPAVETALRERFTYVGRRDGTVFIWQAAPQNASVWIRTDDGRVVIASRGDLSHERTYAGLKVTWDMVSESLKSVTATLAKTDINQVFQETSEFFTASQGQYQYLLFNFQRRNQWALRWPDVRPAWARFIISSAPNYIHYSLQGKPIVSGTDGPNAADITDLAFGEHKLGVSLGFSQASPVVHAFFAKPQATIDVVEIEGGKSVASRQAVSRPLDSLEIPAFDVNTPTVPPIPQGRIVASELGFTSGVDAHLGAGVQLAPVRSSMEAKGWQVKDMIGSLSAYRRNRPDEVVWVFTDGRLIATGRQPLSTSKAIEALEGAWLEAATASAGVTAVLSGVDLRGRMFTSAHYYTARANQYQRLFDLGVDRTSSGLTLDWSNTAEAWVRVMWSGLNGQWKLDNSVLPSIPRTAAPYQVNAGHLTPGQHSLNWGGITSFTNHHDRKIWVKVDAFFPNPSEEIAWYDQSRSNAVTYPAYSQPIDRLWLPKEATK
jgi:hypothetical protein